jgi:hypothetical protein
MAGVDTVIRVIGAVMSLVVIAFVTAVGVTLYEPIAAELGGPPASLGWSDSNFLFFMALGLIGLVLTVFVWMWVSPIREDTRQDVQRRQF